MMKDEEKQLKQYDNQCQLQTQGLFMSQDVYADKTLQPCVSIHRDIHYKLLSKEQLITSKPQKTIQAQQLQKQVENQNNYDFEFQSIDPIKYKESKHAI